MSAVCAALLMTSPAWARVYYVDPAGNNSASGTSTSSAWRSINFAVSRSSPVTAGDEIRVAAGVYNEMIDFRKSGVTLKGIGNVIVRDPTPASGRREGLVDLIGVRNVVIENIALENAYYAGFALRGVNNVVLRQVRTSKTGASGILVATQGRTKTPSANVKILDSEVSESCNRFYQTGRGGHEAITFASVKGFEVANTKVYGGLKEGITVKGSATDGNIHHNKVWNQARVGIYVGGTGGYTRNITVANNMVYRSAHGIAVSTENSGHTENVTIINNVIYSNRSRGIGIAAWGPGPDYSINDVKVINNTVTKNGAIGIHMDNPQATNVLIRNNISYDNASGQQIRVTKGRAVVERNVTSNPRFRNPASGDFSLLSDSPAIDAGMSAYAPSTDFANNRRPLGSGPDIGAYEVR
jgi:hypothetical protein